MCCNKGNRFVVSVRSPIKVSCDVDVNARADQGKGVSEQKITEAIVNQASEHDPTAVGSVGDGPGDKGRDKGHKANEGDQTGHSNRRRSSCSLT